jgi:hypothetical protein
MTKYGRTFQVPHLEFSSDDVLHPSPSSVGPDGSLLVGRRLGK